MELQTRFSFTYNFLVGAASLTRLAIQIDAKGQQASDQEKLQHLAYVSGSIMQSVAALESEIWSLLNHGPGNHLGSNGLDKNGAEILTAVADTIDKESIIEKYNLALKLTRQKQLDLGKQPMQDLNLLIGLRNEITHYKSQWTPEIANNKLLKALKDKDSTPPSFYPTTGMNFFPLICLNCKRAKWGLETAVTFIEYYYKELNIKSPFVGQDRQLITV